MTKKQKKTLIRIIVTAVMTVGLIFTPVDGWLRLFLFLIPYFIIGYDILIKAVKSIINLQPFDECFLMAIATIGALVLAVTGDGDYLEAIAVMLFYQTGEWFQSYAVGKSRRSISELMDIRPDYANIEENGKLIRVDPDEIETGTIIVVKPGEKIPIDGVVTEGSSSLDAAALTGESLPHSVRVGEQVISGCVNLSGTLRIRTEKEFEDSTVSRILDLVENAGSRKSRSENFITRFARVYTPAVVTGALLLALVPPIIRILCGTEALWTVWLYRALTFLVISCPCALVVSVPLSFFAGIGSASRDGILIKGSNYLEQLAKTQIIAFDKTGTLTKGVFEVTKVSPAGISEKELLQTAAAAEQFSTHPVAVSLRNKSGDIPQDIIPQSAEEIAGCGICAKSGKDKICVGNGKLMERMGIEYIPETQPGTVIYVSKNDKFLGSIVISDVIRPTAKGAVEALERCGIERAVMLTGDSRSAAEHIAAMTGIKEIHSGLLPEDKVGIVAGLIEEKKAGRTVAFAGDGINDAPVLSMADIGIAMGAMGSDAAIEAADIVLMDDDPIKIVRAISISNKCLRIVRENIWFSITIKLACLLLGAIGFANMWVAIFADVGVLVLAVLNALRCQIHRNDAV